MQQLELDGDNLAANIRKVQYRLTCAKQRNDNVNVCWSRECLSDEKQKEGNVEYGKDHGASDGIDARGFSEVVARGSVSHDDQETVKIRDKKSKNIREEIAGQPQGEENGGRVLLNGTDL